MDVMNNNNNYAMESMDVGMDMMTSNDKNHMMDSMDMDMEMGMGMGIINDDNDNFRNDNNYFPTTATPMDGVACNELLFLHLNYLCYHNFNVSDQSLPNIYNYLFHHSSCIH